MVGSVGLLAAAIAVGLGALIPGVAWMGFSIFIGAIQSFIFVMLTMVYMSNKVRTD